MNYDETTKTMSLIAAYIGSAARLCSGEVAPKAALAREKAAQDGMGKFLIATQTVTSLSTRETADFLSCLEADMLRRDHREVREEFDRLEPVFFQISSIERSGAGLLRELRTSSNLSALQDLFSACSETVGRVLDTK